MFGNNDSDLRIFRCLREPERAIAFVRYKFFRRQGAYVKSEKRNNMNFFVNDFSCENKKNLCQIVGMPRSGTTMITSLIGNDPNAVVMIEPFLAYHQTGSFRWNDPAGRERVSIKIPKYVIKKLLEKNYKVFFKETWRGVNNSIFPTSENFKTNYENGIKTIAIVRDPRAVWYSTLRFCRFGDEVLPGKLFFDEFFEFVQWVEEEKLTYVRYEDLVEQPVEVLTAALRKVSLEANIRSASLQPRAGVGDHFARSGGSLHNVSTTIWKSELPAKTVNVIDKEMKEILSRFNYWD